MLNPLNQSPQTKSKFLVTGCAGFIASRVSSLLLESGHQVVGIDNVNDYYDVSLKQHRLDKLKEHDAFKFAKIDIEDNDLISDLFDEHEFDAIFNLAARAGVRYSMENPHVYMTTNAMGNLNLLEQARHRGIGKYVLASTSSLYAGQPMPFDETLSVNTPISPYAASKKSAEAMAHAYNYLYGVDISVCRYFTVFGPAGRPDMCIFRFIKWIDEGKPIELLGDGEQSRDFTFVDDIALGTIAATKKVGYEVFNLGGGGTPISLNTVIAKLEVLLKKKALINYLDPFEADIITTQANISKAKKMLGWQPVTSFDDGLKACVDWHLENKPWSNQIVLP